MTETKSIDANVNSRDVGLFANARVGKWELAIDQTLKGPSKWFIQIEGPSLYLYFEIKPPSHVNKAVHFLKNKGRNESAMESDSCELKLGHFGKSPVSLLWDNEYDDRCFLTIGESADSFLRYEVSGKELKDFASAFRKLEMDIGKTH